MWVLGRRRLLLPLLLLLPPLNGQSYDGCKENRSDGEWCCGTNCTRGHCLDWSRNGHCFSWSQTCTTGVALQLNESCKGECNYNRDFRTSYAAVCANTSICVKEWDETSAHIHSRSICSGNSNCEGELAWCKKEERKNEECPSNGPITRAMCSPTLGGSKGGSETNRIPGQCIEERKAKDGRIYHCLDRTDENPFRGAADDTIRNQIDFAKIRNCTTDGNPGLECGGKESSKCVAIEDWCEDYPNIECPLLGPGIFTNNPAVCRYFTFWQGKPCGRSEIRCRAGNSGQCVDKQYWGVLGAKNPILIPETYPGFATEKDIFGNNETSCNDGSDLYRPILKSEEPGRQPSQPQMWKTYPTYSARGIPEDRYDESTDLWMVLQSDPFKVPSIGERNWKSGPSFHKAPLKKKWANFYSRDDYVKDEATDRMVAAPTEQTCRANQGFVCKVRLDDLDMNVIMVA